jgi:predicted ArsR family transcriptional regulator
MDGERQRGAIVSALRDATDGLDTTALAHRIGLHPNTVRWHLGRLADEGLVRSAPERRHARGRPSIVHRLTPEGVVLGRDEYRLLATMLTAALGSDSDGARRAYSTGVEWGRHLHAADPASDVVTLLDRQGFAAQESGDRIEMRRCPFYALAETHPQIVCTLHRGIIDGALDASGSQKRVARLDPFVEPTLCVASLHDESTGPTEREPASGQQLGVRRG